MLRSHTSTAGQRVSAIRQFDITRLTMKGTIILLVLCFGGAYSVQPTSCPTRDWFAAEFVSITDVVIPSTSAAVEADPDLTFFRDIMLFTEEEIERETQDAMEFFNTKFGLDFSQSEPNELGERMIESAVMYPYIFAPVNQYTITYNRWIITGNTNNLCFENRDGGYAVIFTGERLLHGTYGGEEGISVPAGAAPGVVFGYYNIPVCPQEPLVIRYSSGTPFRSNVDGIFTINCDLFHRVWGPGLAQGTFRFLPTEDGRVRVVTRNLFTFPPHPL